MIQCSMIWFLNGRYLPESEAKIPINDLSVLRGYGVFDFLVTYHKKPFMLREHLDRLYHSARMIGLAIPYPKTRLEHIVLTTINKNQGDNLTIRIVVTGGVSSSNILPEGNSSVAVLIRPRQPYPARYYQKGVKLITYEHQRATPEAKHLDYLTAVMAKSAAEKKGFFDALYTYKNQVLECTTANFYIIHEGMLITPRTDILHGVTKKVVLKIAQTWLPVAEKNINLNELTTADEAFISASDKEIMPVVRIDQTKIGDGRPGKFTQKITAEYRRLTRG